MAASCFIILFSFRAVYAWLALSLALIQILFFSNAAAQLQNPVIKNFNVAHGLSHNTVRDIVQDPRGFLWLATDDGLNCFDGYTFTVYSHNARDTNSLPHPTINDLCLDSRGNLWVATQNGLAQFSLATETFTRYLSGFYVTSLIADSAGALWIGTNKGLHCFNPAEQKWRNWTAATSALRSDHIFRLYLDSRGSLWVIYAYDPIQILDPKTETFYAFSNAAIGFIDKLYAVYEDSHRTFWILTHGGALWRYSPTARGADSLQLISSVPLLYAVRDAVAMCGLEDQGGRLWIGLNGAGIFIFDPRTAQLLRAITAEQAEWLGLSSLYILSMLRDQTGIVWIGTDIGGLYKWDWHSELFNFYGRVPSQRNTLSHRLVRGIYADTNGTVWVCTQGGGLNKLERQGGTRKWTHYTVESHRAKGLPTNHLWSIRALPTGEFWIGGSCALIKFNPKTETFHADSLSDGNVTTLCLDEQSNLWVGTDINVLFRDAKTGKMKVLDNPFSPMRNFRYVEALYKEGETLWIGSPEGLYRANASRFEVQRHYTFGNVADSRVSENYVTCIYRDSRGLLWVSTKGGGLKILKDTATGAFESISTENGLPHNHVYAVLEDRSGHLWVSTDRGIAEYNPEMKRFRVFTIADGLQSNEFNRQAYFKSASGEFFFGGINGFNSFFPKNLSQHAAPLRPILTLFKKHNEPARLDTAISQRASLELSHLDDFFSFEFAASDFHTPEQKRYRYKLDGYDKDWIETDATRREAVYRNLPAGEYAFRVQVANADGVWSHEEVALPLVMRPAPWRTWWAYSSFLILGAGAIALFVWQRTQRLRRENLRLESLVEARTQEILQKNQLLESQAQELLKLNELRLQFFSMATHDLKNPLQAISGFSRLIEEEKQLDNIKIYGAYISKAAARMLRLIEELLESVALDLGKVTLNCKPTDICALIKSAIEQNQVIASQKSQRIVFQSNSNVPLYANVDANRIMKVLDNLISNAMKYSLPETTITISCQKFLRTQSGAPHLLNVPSQNGALLNPCILISVADEGLGLSKEDLKKLFGRFQRLSARPTSNETSSGLGLSIVKDLVEMHGGTVWGESEGQGKGATFFVMLPAISE